MKSFEVRKTFFDFFKSKNHNIISSAPMVIKNDPTLMFTNAGMNQFKDIFLGNSKYKDNRVTNTQKCLRVSGKHNDLEEVGHDTYHHTMFEMLGNWSFGDYFKKEAIEWGWELLTEVYNIDKHRLYVTIFEGDKKDNLSFDKEASEYWKQIIPKNRIIMGSKKDNFWEMGETGPCGPCSEIHVDLRNDSERDKQCGSELVNKDHPLVIEIWNLVFIEFNRLANGDLEPLPMKHIDTGMGFERLCMVMQEKKSNYDTDIFQPIITEIARLSKKKYGIDANIDSAMHVIADHLRAVSFAIGDGQLPSNIKAGYVIRRILRRAVRYGYTFLGFKEPFLNKLVPLLVAQMGSVFPEIEKQQNLIRKVIAEEEIAFLRTLASGIQKFEQYIIINKGQNIIDGKFAFELFDTYGFPIDLTQLMAKENGLDVDMVGFNKGLDEQKSRSRNAAAVDTDDWVEIFADDREEFVGYDYLEVEVKITRYRKVKTKKKELYHLVFNFSPFYAEAGGQVGDTGFIESKDEKTFIIDTKRENNLIIHITEKLPVNLKAVYKAVVNRTKRENTEANHTAAHLMHYALRSVLGSHVEQKGSLVDSNHLRFDFSHFQKLSSDEICKVEAFINNLIRENIALDEHRAIPMKRAEKLGALAFFGDKYGDLVRVIKFGDSVELCGGTHVQATGRIGYFKIISEGAIAAGIRRIEAITGAKAEQYSQSFINTTTELKLLFKGQKDIVKAVTSVIEQNNALQKDVALLKKEKASSIKDELISKVKNINGVNFIAERVSLDPITIKDMAFNLKNSIENLFLVIGTEVNGKASLSVILSDNLIEEKGLNAGTIIKELSKYIHGGGGGQAYFATAGGKNPEGIETALKKAVGFIK